jgi:fumarate reductase flavoprotein subunit
MNDDTRVHDLVVIGGGVAGWTTARRAQQLGVGDIVVIDRGPSGPGWSNSLLSGGRIHATYLNPRTADPDELFERVTAKTEGAARPDVARAWADNAGRAVTFLASEGANIVAKGAPQYMQTALDGVPRSADPYTPWRDGGPERALTAMWRTYHQAGGKFLPNTRAVDLQLSDGRVTGVQVENADGRSSIVHARAVVMADGGFQANRELVAQYVTKHTYRPLGSEYDVGDCLLMGLRHGAQAVNMESFYGNLCIRDTLTNENLALLAPPTELIAASMVVNGRGERVGDEAVGTEEWSIIDIRLATPVAKTDTPDCWIVFDDAVWETVGRSDVFGQRNRLTVGLTMNPTIEKEGGTLITADSIEELAGLISAPAGALRSTADTFNRHAIDGTPIEPQRTGEARPVTQKPFHAIPLLIGIYFTMGGLLVNAHAQVLSTEEQPIPGLYAVGGTMGGLQGGPHNGYAGGWTEASTFGLLAAEHVASALSPEAQSAVGAIA